MVLKRFQWFDTGLAVTVVATVAIAGFAGHLMQSGQSVPAAPLATSDPDWTPLPTRKDGALLLTPGPLLPEPTTASLRLVVPGPPPGAFTEAVLPTSAVPQLRPQKDAAVMPASDDDLELDGFGMACGLSLTASAAEDASILLAISAPCLPGGTVTLTHAGLTGTVGLDNAGTRNLVLPALDAAGRVTIRDEGGQSAEAAVSVPSLAEFDRVALAWSGPSGISIHALEFGARPGQGGHVSAARVETGLSQGSVTRIGDGAAGPIIEIYSFPAGRTSDTGTVRLTVAAEVTADTCETDLPVTKTVLRAGTDLERTETTLSFPACDGAGSILVLKNLLEDLKIAGNTGL